MVSPKSPRNSGSSGACNNARKTGNEGAVAYQPYMPWEISLGPQFVPYVGGCAVRHQAWGVDVPGR